MQETLVVNGVRIQKCQSPFVRVVSALLDTSGTLNVMCPEGTSDEAILTYVKDHFPNVIFPEKHETEPQSGSQKKTFCKPDVVKMKNKRIKYKNTQTPYNPMNDPRNPFSPVVPKVEKETMLSRIEKTTIASIVKNSQGMHIQYKFNCSYCGKSFVHGCEYKTLQGRKIVVCSFCRGEILQFKGWIHEISANIGHGRK